MNYGALKAMRGGVRKGIIAKEVLACWGKGLKDGVR